MARARRAAAVLGGFVVRGVATGAAVGAGYGLVLTAVASFGENTPGSTVFVDSLFLAIPGGCAFGAGAGAVSGAGCGLVFAGLTLAGALPGAGTPPSVVPVLVAAGVALALTRGLLGLFFEPGVVFVWGPSGLGALAAAAIGYQLLPQSSEAANR